MHCPELKATENLCPWPFRVTFGWGLAACPVCIGLGFLEQMMWPWGIGYNLPMTTCGMRLAWAEECRAPPPGCLVQPQECVVVGPSSSCPLLWNISERLYLMGSFHKYISVRNGVWQQLQKSFGKKIENTSGLKRKRFVEIRMWISIYLCLLLRVCGILWPKYRFFHMYL